MKKTNNINLGRQVFCIDEDAYSELQSYIDTLEKYYLKEEGGAEIMSDIEHRLAELLAGYINEKQRASITVDDIGRAIQIMGAPDDIIDEPQTEAPEKTNKILYRDTDNRVFGGVAAGIATYLGLPITLLRILFILPAFFYGVTILLYIILWIAMPKAVTAKQKLEMKGKTINVSNIEKNIRDNYNEIKKSSKIESFFQNVGKFLTDFFNLLGSILKKVFSIILSIISVIAIAGSLFLFIAFFWGMLFSSTLPWGNSYGGIAYIMSGTFIIWAKITLTLIVSIPLLLIMYLSVKYLIGFKNKSSIPLFAGGLWILACVAGLIFTINTTLQFSQKYQENSRTIIESNNASKKYIALQTKSPLSSRHSNLIASQGPFHLSAFDSSGHIQLANMPELFIEKTDNHKPELYIRKKARGFSTINAKENEQAIRFDWQVKNDTLTFDNLFTITNGKRWRNNEVYMTLYLPENYQVDFVNLPLNDISNPGIIKDTTDYSYGMVRPRHYIMKEGYLIPVK